jgi:hypothetical protein
MTRVLGPACLECMRVCVGEESRICFVGCCGDCGPVRFRLGRARALLILHGVLLWTVGVE